jgi:hypothetical protein
VLPPVWGPDADEAPPGDPETGEHTGWDDSEPGRSWLRLAMVLGGVIVLVVAVVIAFTLGQGAGTDQAGDTPSPDASASATPEPVKIASVSDFDPDGDGSENPGSAPLAVDGDPGSAWRTVTYYDPLELQKAGVGLLLDLGKPVTVSQLSVTFIGSPTSFEVLAADKGAPAPTSTDGLTRVAQETGAGTKADVRLEKPVTTRYLVLWLTKLPPTDGGFRGQVAEIDVRG